MFYPNRTFKSEFEASSQPLSVWCKKAVDESHLRWENRNLTSAENMKLATARKPTLSLSILVTYHRLNQDEWVSPLVPSQHVLQDQGKIYSIYGVFK